MKISRRLELFISRLLSRFGFDMKTKLIIEPVAKLG
jgi:hypothetical protein